MSAIGADELVRRLDAAVSAGDVETITRRVQSEIENVLQPGRLRLEERFRQTLPDHYARRLLHRDPARRYTILVLAWAPGQGTPIHDHPNLWSVEGVLEGELEVTQYAP
ncbi:MAG: cysteine dioxygenase family protein, partial [Acidobacteria bacterium]|nr:cysteine dioxygenase family protein [Acidobacteriota bacterium]